MIASSDFAIVAADSGAVPETFRDESLESYQQPTEHDGEVVFAASSAAHINKP